MGVERRGADWAESIANRVAAVRPFDEICRRPSGRECRIGHRNSGNMARTTFSSTIATVAITHEHSRTA